MPAMQKVLVNGMPLWYVARGIGAPIVLVHGAMADLRVWFNQLEPFSHAGRVFAFSRRYSWPNTLPAAEADASVARQVDDLAGFIAALRLGRVHLVGHSYGGQLGLFLAIRHPEMVRTLVVAEPAVFSVLAGVPQAAADVQADLDFRTGEMGPALSSGDGDRITKTFLGYVDPGVFARIPPDIQNMYLTNVPAFEADLAAPGLPFACSEAGRITAPTLVLQSDGAPAVYRRTCEAVAGCIPGSTLLTIRRTNHLLQLDDPESFNEAVLAFIAKH
jgi:pimeloyl-ACP methyl ester carboxylesterase